VDGGSTDNTLSAISNFQFPNFNKKIRVRVIVKKGNRSVGRNEAIRNSTGDIIACSDAGCILDKDWLKNIVKPFSDPKVDVVSGYYKGMAKSAFEKALVPFALVMEDKLDANNFLPATRSVAFKKNIWKKVGGFDEKLSNNEDYVFARKLKKIGAKILFAKDAVVFWKPRKNLKDAFVMFYRFAKGDAESGIIRPKVVFILGRYIAGFLAVFLLFYTHSLFLVVLILVLFINYVLWAALKNYKYVDNLLSVFYLIALQFLSDFAVIAGTLSGLISRLGKRS
ncbi:MAG: sugar transferase related protein, partial [uncultured bacterium]